MLIHCGNLLVVRIEGREARDVADAAVRIMRLHKQTLRGAPATAPFLRKDDETLKRRFIRDAVGHAFAQPTGKDLMRFGTTPEAEAAFVRHHGGGLLDDEAFVRRGGKHAPAARVFYDVRVIGLRVVGKYRELEAVLALGLGMTRARVATRFAQRWQDVAEEADRRWFKDG